jgi:hypothetical protein
MQCNRADFWCRERHFWILLLAPEYNLEIQARILAVLCAIHNFIAKYDSSDALLSENTLSDHDGYYDHVNFVGAEPEWENNAGIQRDQIAETMWESYRQICAERGEVDLDLGDELRDDDTDDDD